MNPSLNQELLFPLSTIDKESLSAMIAFPSPEMFTVEESYTGAALIQLPKSDVTQFDDLFEWARVAQTIWRNIDTTARSQLFRRLFTLVSEAQDELAHLIQAETGKTFGQAYEEVFATLSTIRFLSFSGPKILRPDRRGSGIPLLLSTTVVPEPLGVVGIITPWNYPLSLAAFDALPAIFAGNSVIQKVDSLAPLAVLKLRSLMRQAGLPDAVWHIVTGDGATAGQAIVDRADYLAFTGSTQTGKKLYRDVAARFVSGSFELGGKNACLILPDANISAAVKQLLYSSFSSLGQLCVSIERVYVPEALQQEFESELKLQLTRMSIGSSYHGEYDYGSLISIEQKERISAIVERAKEQGATVLFGGIARPDLGPYFFEPTVLSNMTDTMDSATAESFGPVLGVFPYRTVFEAITRINDTDYGLNASIFTKNVKAAKRIIPHIRTGSVNINEGYRATFSSAAADMGGTKMSGLGRRNGAAGVLRFTESKTISRVRFDFPLPTTAKDFRIMVPLMKLVQKALYLFRRG